VVAGTEPRHLGGIKPCLRTAFSLVKAAPRSRSGPLESERDRSL